MNKTAIRGAEEVAQLLKNTCCSCRAPGFSSQHTQGGLQVSITLVSGHLAPSSGLWALAKNALPYVDKIFIHIK